MLTEEQKAELLVTFRRRTNGIVYASRYANEIVAGTIKQGSKSQSFRLKLDDKDCILGPDDAKVVAMKGIPFTKQSAPISLSNTKKSIKAVLDMFNDPLGVGDERSLTAEDYELMVRAEIIAWKEKGTNLPLFIGSFDLPLVEYNDGQRFSEYILTNTGKTKENIAAILSTAQSDIEKYFAWLNGTERKEETIEMGEGVV